jgi:hypothetical protein
LLGGGVATFNSNIAIGSSTPLDSGERWSVEVHPLNGGTFGGNGDSAVNIRITCARVGG